MRKFVIAASSLVGLVFSNPANAAVYRYTLGSGDVLTIDTTLMTGSLIGSQIYAQFSGRGLALYPGGTTPSGFISEIDIDPRSWLTGAVASGDPSVVFATKLKTQRLDIGYTNSNKVTLWTTWGREWNPVIYYAENYTTDINPRSGTGVPEPGMVGLLALGLLGAGYARGAARVRVRVRAIR